MSMCFRHRDEDRLPRRLPVEGALYLELPAIELRETLTFEAGLTGKVEYCDHVTSQGLCPQTIALREEHQDRRQVSQELTADFRTHQARPLWIPVAVGRSNAVEKSAVATAAGSVGPPAVVLRPAAPNGVFPCWWTVTLAIV
jgi:hypothetical protein